MGRVSVAWICEKESAIKREKGAAIFDEPMSSTVRTKGSKGLIGVWG